MRLQAGLHVNLLYLHALDVGVSVMVRIAISCLGLAAICDREDSVNIKG